jgi:hypothetical protein
VVDTFRDCDLIGVDITVIAELFSGFSLAGKEKRNRQELEAFLDSPRVEILFHDLETADYCVLIAKIKDQRSAHSHKQPLDSRQCHEARLGSLFIQRPLRRDRRPAATIRQELNRGKKWFFYLLIM